MKIAIITRHFLEYKKGDAILYNQLKIIFAFCSISELVKESKESKNFFSHDASKFHVQKLSRKIGLFNLANKKKMKVEKKEDENQTSQKMCLSFNLICRSRKSDRIREIDGKEVAYRVE